jgi:hypothetical protein
MDQGMMNRGWFLLLLIVQSVAVADVTNLAPGHYQVLERSSLFVSTTNLPPAIVALCADSSGRLAQPSEPWEPTDAISDESLPRKRLISAAVSDHYFVVHYERGGRGHSFHILFATFENGEATAVWRAVGGPFQNYADFLHGLRTDRVNDDPRYAY